jgi:hypothetical protein
MDETLRCERCGDVIGVYEPLIALRDGIAHETSRAADPKASSSGAGCFHRACYQRRESDHTRPDSMQP